MSFNWVSLALLLLPTLDPGAAITTGRATRHEAPSAGALPDRPTPRLRVDCRLGQSLGQALRLPISPLIVEFLGSCSERLHISRDDLTLSGLNASAEIVGSVTVAGSSRVRLEAFTIRDTPEGVDVYDPAGDALRVLGSQAVAIDGLRIRDPGRRGISAESSSLEVANTVISGASGIGFVSIASATELAGELSISGTTGPGLMATFNSNIFVRRFARVSVLHNAIGILVQQSSSLTLVDATEIQANDNQFVGLAVSSQGVVSYGETTLEARRNLVGVQVAEVSSFVPLAEGIAPRITLAENAAVGLIAARSSFVRLISGVSVQQNGIVGLLVDGSEAELDGIECGPHPFVGRALFGSRLLFGPRANTLDGPIFCEASVLSRGEPGCGAALDETAPAVLVPVIQAVGLG